MKNLKNENAITLIALVVTIIVLLILAGTVISMLAGDNGILHQAVVAKEKTEKESIQEMFDLAILENKMGNKSNDMKIDKRNGYYIITYKGIDYLYVEGEAVTEYKNTVAYYMENNEFKKEDYIDYKQGKGLNTQNGTYTMETSQTGFEKNQTYNVSSYDGKWQVLYTGTEGYGVQIISRENILKNESSDVLKIKGKTGYNNLINTLNTLCKYYINKTYAIDARSFGTDPANPEGTDEIYEGIYGIEQEKEYKNANISVQTQDLYRLPSEMKSSPNKMIWMSCRHIARGENTGSREIHLFLWLSLIS